MARSGHAPPDAMRLDGEQHMVKALPRAVLITAATTVPAQAATVVVAADGTGTTGPCRPR